MTVEDALSWAKELLEGAGVPEARREAEILLAACLGWERARLIAYPEAALPEQQRQRFECWVRRRARREPLAYITRRARFYGLELTVGRGALIPRPETELLVEVFLEWAAQQALTPLTPLSHCVGEGGDFPPGKGTTPEFKHPAPTSNCSHLTPLFLLSVYGEGGMPALHTRSSPSPFTERGQGGEVEKAGENEASVTEVEAMRCTLVRDSPLPRSGRGDGGEGFPIFVDAGTGSGAIAIACLKHASPWLGVGIDHSRRTLHIAQTNRRKLGLDAHLMLIQSDWLTALRPRSVNAVLSNPPYVLPDEWDALQPEIRDYEPRAALVVPADDPLQPYRRIAQDALRVLRPPGLLAFETSPRLAPMLTEHLPRWGFPNPQIRLDYSGKERVVYVVLE